MTKIGKRVVDDLYIHLSAVRELEDAEHRGLIEQAMLRVPTPAELTPVVAKLNLRTRRLSLLAYRDFDDDPFPELAASWAFAPGSTGAPSYRIYADSLNPPILHRKELLVPLSYPGREGWVRLTSTAESLGLFDDTTTIGFKLNWQRLVESKGYRLAGDEFVPVGNDLDSSDAPLGQIDGPIQRHLTALTRSNLSAPVQLLFRHGLLPPGTAIFDYGCGRGGDVAGLAANGFTAHGWDPHFAADQPIFEADVVNLGFVVNVIEDPAERVDAMHKAFKLARRVMSIGVMLYGSDPPGRPFRDGFLTSRNTFQKYFSQSEFKDFIEHVLHQEVFMVGPGVAFVFADKEAEQRFSAGRFRTRGVAERLLAARIPRVQRDRSLRERTPKAPRRTRSEQELDALRPLLDELWSTSLELGRLPESDEIPDRGAVEVQVGSVGKALRLIVEHYDQSLLAAARHTRTDDLRLFFAMQQFGKRPPYRSLEPRLQRDVKALFEDYRAAQGAGLELLGNAADSECVRAACRIAAEHGIGYLGDDRSLQLHLSLVERLPVVLRAYVACGLVLYDAVSDFQLVKIHVESGKLTLLQYEDFDVRPLPLLVKRIKINIRLQDYDVFEYGGAKYPKPLLFWKSRYLNEDVPGYAEQLAFDEQLDASGLVPDSEHGPAAEAFQELIESRRQAVVGFTLVRSQAIPDLDRHCGANFTYRDLIECGQTQHRLGIRNLPLQPESYNALYDLATKLLDPLIEYFGAIKLTYGFCSTDLSRQIAGQIAPKLDQHAACEVGRGGKLICDRGGAACDLLVEDEDMRAVADWVIENLPFDRLYFYGSDRAIHLSYGPQHQRSAYQLVKTASGASVPKRYFPAR